MPYRQSNTQCVVRLVPLRGVSSATIAHCQALRQEPGRLWMDLIRLHAEARVQGMWLSATDLEQMTKGGQYALHSQSVQALCLKFAANVAPATELRQQELAEMGRPLTNTPSSQALPDGRLEGSGASAPTQRQPASPHWWAAASAPAATAG